jgi:hypothetical protein
MAESEIRELALRLATREGAIGRVDDMLLMPAIVADARPAQ